MSTFDNDAIDPKLIEAINAINEDDPTANIGVEPTDPAARDDDSPTPASTEEGAGGGAAANQPPPASTPPDADELIAAALSDDEPAEPAEPDNQDQGEASAPGAPEAEDELAAILAEHLGHVPSVDEIVGLLTLAEQQANPQPAPYDPGPYNPTPAQPLPGAPAPTPTSPAPAPQQFQPVPIPEYADEDVKSALRAQNANIEAMNAQLAQAEQQRQAYEAEQQRIAAAENERYLAAVRQGYTQAQSKFYEDNPDLTTRQKVRLEKALQTDGRVWAFVQNAVQNAATPAEGITQFYDFLAYSDDDIRNTIDAARASRAAKQADDSAKRKAKASASAGGGGAIPRDNVTIPTTREGRDKAALALLDEAFANPQAE